MYDSMKIQISVVKRKLTAKSCYSVTVRSCQKQHSSAMFKIYHEYTHFSKQILIVSLKLLRGLFSDISLYLFLYLNVFIHLYNCI
jgi:hypothetical protein